MRFEHQSLPQRVVFDSGHAAEHLPAELSRLGVSAPLVIAAEAETALAEMLTGELRLSGWHRDVAMHVPEPTAKRAREAAERSGADALVSIGGGSTTGLAKAVALTTGMPIVAIPTTYAGSEATAIWGITRGGEKTTGIDDRVLPRVVIYDAALTLTLPVPLSVASGLNALAHAIDSMWAPQSDPIDRALATEAIRALRQGLPEVAAAPSSLSGRERMLYASYLAARAFSSAGSGLHHKICHALGGAFDLPHAQTHAILLPHVLGFNAAGAPREGRQIAQALGATKGLQRQDAVSLLLQLYGTLDAPRSLRELGLDQGALIEVVGRIVASAPPGNPVPVTPEAVTTLLLAAWEGSVAR